MPDENHNGAELPGRCAEWIKEPLANAQSTPRKSRKSSLRAFARDCLFFHSFILFATFDFDMAGARTRVDLAVGAIRHARDDFVCYDKFLDRQVGTKRHKQSCSNKKSGWTRRQSVRKRPACDGNQTNSRHQR